MLLDVLMASVMLLVILIPATELVSTSGRVVTTSKAQAIAQSLAASVIEGDQATWSSEPAPGETQPFSASPCAGTSYGSGSPNATFSQILTGCETVPSTGGMPLWVFQRSGWCVESGSSLGNGSQSSSSDWAPSYWVLVMVAWGGSTVPAPGSVVSEADRVVVSSALATPSTYALPTSTTSCPL